jgi:hypothetical protein
MTHFRRNAARAAVFAAVSAAVLYLAALPDGRTADKSDPQNAAAGALDYVPADAVAVLSVRIADY